MDSFKEKLRKKHRKNVALNAVIVVASGIALSGTASASDAGNVSAKPQSIASTACGACGPCNPCSPCNPCNPCAACNPCAIKKGCAPCNPCNPCAVKKPNSVMPVQSLSVCEAKSIYKSLEANMAGYRRSGLIDALSYRGWKSFSTQPFYSRMHGSRFVKPYVNVVGEKIYGQYEKSGEMPKGTVLVMDSFTAYSSGRFAAGPLYMMEKMSDGFDDDTRDWKYSVVMPNGRIVGVTNGEGSDAVQFCAQCHNRSPNQNSVFFLPEAYRVK